MSKYITKLNKIIERTTKSFNCFLDPKYKLNIVSSQILPLSITISIIPKSETYPEWWYYKNDNATPALSGYLDSKPTDSQENDSLDATISALKVGFWVPNNSENEEMAQLMLGNKGIGQFLILIFLYICAWMNIKNIELDDMASKTGFYQRLGFTYKERDSPPEMILDLYSIPNFGYINILLKKIIQKPNNEYWQWNTKCEFPVTPNPSTLLGGKNKIKKIKKTKKTKKSKKSKKQKNKKTKKPKIKNLL